MMSQHDAPPLPAPAPSSPQGTTPGAPAVAEPTVRRYNIFADLFRGIFRGAYAVDNLHAPGLLAWIVVGFVPVLGTLAAARDAYYCIEVREWGGLLLNLLGFLPFVKGFANIVEVAQLHRLHRAAHTTHQVARVARRGRMMRAGGRGTAAAITGAAHEAGAFVIFFGRKVALSRNGAAWPALLLALVTAVFFPLMVGLALNMFAGSVSLGFSIPLPVVLWIGGIACLGSLGVLLLADYARRAATALRGRPFSRGIVAFTALCIAWLGFLVTLGMTIFFVYLERTALSAL